MNYYNKLAEWKKSMIPRDSQIRRNPSSEKDFLSRIPAYTSYCYSCDDLLRELAFDPINEELFIRCVVEHERHERRFNVPSKTNFGQFSRPPIDGLEKLYEKLSVETYFSKLLDWVFQCAPLNNIWKKAWEIRSVKDRLLAMSVQQFHDKMDEIEFIKAVIEFQSCFREMEEEGILFKYTSPPVNGLENLYTVTKVVST